MLALLERRRRGRSARGGDSGGEQSSVLGLQDECSFSRAYYTPGHRYLVAVARLGILDDVGQLGAALASIRGRAEAGTRFGSERSSRYVRGRVGELVGIL